MSLANYLVIDFFPFLILLILYVNIRQHIERYSVEQKLFLAMIFSNMLIILLDACMWIADGRPGQLFGAAIRIVTLLYYVLSPVLCLFWTLYADYQIYRDDSRLKRIVVPLLIPIILNGFMSLMSLQNHWMFYFDELGQYQRGEGFWLMAAASYYYFIYTFIQILVMRKKINQKVFFSLLIFAVPPFIGGIIQVSFFGISLVWASTTLSIIIIFINIQNYALNTDYLTGLSNRRHLNDVLKDFIGGKGKSRSIGGILIDINHFKMINDQYGHLVGDSALEEVSGILRKSLRRDDFISRCGGDEFAVIMEVKSEAELENAVERIRGNIDKFNRERKVPYELGLSIGYAVFDSAKGMTVQQFMDYIDGLMYANKNDNNCEN